MGRPKKAPRPITPDSTLDDLLEGHSPSKASPEKKFQEVLNHYNARNQNREEGLSGVSLYFFRTFPQTNNALTGRQHSNIEKFECVKTEGEITEVSELPADIRGYITQRHGGGRYRVSLNDKARTANQVMQTAIKVDEMEFPPILDPRELVVSNAETAGWITRQVSLGLLVRNSDGSYAMSNGAGARPATAAATEDSTGLAAVAMEALRQSQRGTGVEEHAYRTAIDLVKENAPKATDPLATIQAMAAVMKGNGGGELTAIVGLMSTMMVEQNKMMMFMMQQKNPQSRGGGDGEDTVDRVERMMDVIGKYGGPKPSGGGILEMVKEWVPMLLPLLMMGKMPPQAAAALAGMTSQTHPAPDAAPGGVPGGVPGAQPTDGPLTPAQANDFAMRAMNAMQRGHTGDDFAQAIEIMFSPETYDRVRNMGRDNIISFLLQSQAAQFFGSNGPQTTQFIAEFISYGDPAPDAPASGTPVAAVELGRPPV
jgi:hypothetical protein